MPKTPGHVGLSWSEPIRQARCATDGRDREKALSMPFGAQKTVSESKELNTELFSLLEFGFTFSDCF